MKTSLELDNIEGSGVIAIEAKRLMDILKEFPEQPLTFNINLESFQIDIISDNGKYSIVGMDGEEFPQITELNENYKSKITIKSSILASLLRLTQ